MATTMVDDLKNLWVTFEPEAEGKEPIKLCFGGGRHANGRLRPEVKAHKMIDADGCSVTWYFADGAMARLRTANFPPEIQQRLMLHGIAQKFGDSYASATTVMEARNNFDTLVAQLMGGDWERKRTPGDGAGSLLARAIAEVTGESVADVKKLIEGLTAAERKALELDEEYRPVIERLRAEAVKVSEKDVAEVKAKLQGLLKGAA